MKILFIHPNFPGQFLHLVRHYAEQPDVEVVGLGEQHSVAKQVNKVPGVRVVTYRLNRVAHQHTHHYIRGFESNILRAQAALRACLGLKNAGFIPDIIIAHPGWGDLLFIRQVFPKARLLAYMEFYYHPQGKDMGFDPEFPISLDNQCELKIKNATHLLSVEECDQLWSPTEWQASLFPEHIRKRIRVLHEGVNTSIITPDPQVQYTLPTGQVISRGDEILTLINRHMEPYRGFHVFMRALPEIQKARPKAITVIVGSDLDVQYSNSPKCGGTWKDVLLREVGHKLDMSRLHFVGQLSHSDYLRVLQVSRVHVYLTYPFILSWSMMEAMAAGCLLVASNTPPVVEVVKHQENGLLFDFFDQNTLIGYVTAGLTDVKQFDLLRKKARQTVIKKYDLSVTLPEYLDFIGG